MYGEKDISDFPLTYVLLNRSYTDTMASVALGSGLGALYSLCCPRSYLVLLQKKPIGNVKGEKEISDFPLTYVLLTG